VTTSYDSSGREAIGDAIAPIEEYRRRRVEQEEARRREAWERSESRPAGLFTAHPRGCSTDMLVGFLEYLDGDGAERFRAGERYELFVRELARRAGAS
jgi:hypothetical protein